MLERVAVHRLESGGLRLLRNGRARKRMLHSGFWVHGAGELDLASAAASLFGGATGGECYDEDHPSTATNTTQRSSSQSNATSRRNDLIQLDFLYPSGALTFLRHFGRAIPRRDGSQVFPLGGVKRDYSSSTQTSGDRLEARKLEEPSKSKELPPLEPMPDLLPIVPEPNLKRPDGDPFNRIKEIRDSMENGHYESCWYHYWRMSVPTNPTNRLIWRHFLIRYLLHSRHKLETIRVMSLIRKIPQRQWTKVEYESLVRCYLRLDMPRRALEVLRDNVTCKKFSRDSGFEVFMRHCLLRKKYDLLEEAWKILRGLDESPGMQERPTGDRKMDLNTVAMPSMREPELFGQYFDACMEYAKSVPEKKYTCFDLRDELAEELVKSCLRYITRTEAPWSGDYWEIAWLFIRKRKKWVAVKNDWERVIHYLAAHRQDVAATWRYKRYRIREPKAVPISLMNQVLKCFARMEDYDGMKMLWDDIYLISDAQKPSEESYSVLMAALARRGQVAEVRLLLQDFESQYGLSQPMHFSHIMQAHVERGEIRGALEWFDRMKERGVKPDTIAYNIIINGFRRVGDVDAAAARVQDLLAEGLSPDRTTYNILLRICADRGDVTGAENLFDLIKKSGLEVDAYAYEAMVSVYCAIGDMQKAEAILDRIVGMQFEQSVSPIWNTVMSKYLEYGNQERVNQLMAAMHQHKIAFDYHTYGIVMHSLCLADKMDVAEETLTFMKESGFKISTDKYVILMVGYLSKGDYESVWSTFKRMIDSGLKADFKTLAVLLKSYAHAEKQEFEGVEGNEVFLSSTESILDGLSEQDLDIGSFDYHKSATPAWLFTPVINVYYHKSAWERAIAIFQRFLNISKNEEYGVGPNIQMYGSMMRVFLAGGDIEAAKQMWYGLKDASIYKHKAVDLKRSAQRKIVQVYENDIADCLSTIIRALVKIGDYETIDHEVQDIQQLGYTLDNVNWNDYVQAMVLAGRTLEAAVTCEKQLMSRWREVRLYFMYQDPLMRGEDLKELPSVRPFLRTIESLATELRSLQTARQAGNEKAKQLLIAIYRDAPTVWEACDGLEDLDERINKELYFRLQKGVDENWRMESKERRAKRDSAQGILGTSDVNIPY
ncbi:hypothetical protein BZA77DRAFT_319410 [Pyronema omphalodes]|nr:hypothetical protein BZA77DRAFT_319410 [Pyronema omphalodes]